MTLHPMETAPIDRAEHEAWLRELTPLREALREERAYTAGTLATRLERGCLRPEQYAELAAIQTALAAVEAVELERLKAVMAQERDAEERRREREEG